MTLASSGSINMVGPDSSPRRSIGVELGNGTLVAPVSLLSTAIYTLTGKSGGPITMPGDFYGRSTAFIFNDVIPSYTGVADYNLRTRAIAAGWNGVSILYATTTLTDASSFIYASFTTSPAMSDGITAYPNGSTWSIVNNGYITGCGGAAGAGGAVSGASTGAGTNGGDGGPAIFLNGNIPVSLTNNSAIGSGGGGGGGGGSAYYTSGKKSGTYGAGGGGGGGGGGAYLTGIPGGAAGGASGNSNNYPGAAGAASNAALGGAGGAGGSSTGVIGGNGGAGGNWGAAGSAGVAGNGNTNSGGAGTGGQPGYAIYGVSNVTFVVTGNIYGATI